MIDLIETATKLAPPMPIELFTLDPTDRNHADFHRIVILHF